MWWKQSIKYLFTAFSQELLDTCWRWDEKLQFDHLLVSLLPFCLDALILSGKLVEFGASFASQ